MDDALFGALKKVYYGKNRAPLSGKESRELLDSGYPVSDVVEYSHEEVIRAYKELLRHPALSVENLLAAYVCGFSSFPRGRQPVLSYLFARAVPEHPFAPAEAGGDVCAVCSMPEHARIQKGREIFRKYWGYAWNEVWEKQIVELQEFSQLPPRAPEKEDISVFRAVIDCIRNAPEGETPGELEQRIRRGKIVPGYEKYRFRGQLIALAELGVMPNPYILPLWDGFVAFRQRCEIAGRMHGGQRSDIPLPLSGWRGEDAVREDRLQLLFGAYL